MKVAVFSGCTLLALIYGAVVHGVRSNVPRYHAIRKPSTCRMGDDEFTVEEYHSNPHRHPNHCWKFMDEEYPYAGNMSFPERTGDASFDLAPFSTASSLLYLVVGLLVDDPGASVLLALLSASSTELHRAPDACSRHSDWGSIAPLLAWCAVSGLATPQSETALARGRSAGVVLVFALFWTSYQDMLVAIAIGTALFLARTAYEFWINPPSRITLLVTVLCGAAAFVAKEYGDGNLPGIPDHHHLSECANDAKSDAIEDVVHSLWHVFSALAVLLFFGAQKNKAAAKPFPSQVGFLCQSSALDVVVTVAASAVIVTAGFNNDAYWAWLLVAFGSSVACVAVDVYNEKLSHPNGFTKYRAIF